MASFDLAIPKTLSAEGRYFDRSSTTGEVVSRGITVNTLRSLGILPPRTGPATDGEKQYVQNLTEDQARTIYRKYYWDQMNLDSIEDQTLAAKLFDLGVNTGVVTAAHFLQRAINKIRWPGPELVEDGKIGPQTIAAANICEANELLAEVRNQAATHYRNIAEENPLLAGDLQGWLNRLES